MKPWLFIHMSVLLMTFTAHAESSLSVERKGNSLVVVATTDLPSRGELLLAKVAGLGLCPIRIIPADAEHHRDSVVIIIQDTARPSRRCAPADADCREITLSRPPVRPGLKILNFLESKIFVRPGEPTEVVFPGEVQPLPSARRGTHSR